MQRRLLLALALLSIYSYSWSADSIQSQALLAAGEYQQVLAEADAQLKEAPDDVRALFLRAIALARLSRSKEAIAAYQQLIKAQPELPEPYNNLAVLYAREGNYQAAEQVLQAAIKTHPSYATAHENLSNIYKTLASIAYNNALNLNNGKQTAADKASLATIDALNSYQPPVVEIVEPPQAELAPPAEADDTEAMTQAAANNLEQQVLEEKASSPPPEVDMNAVEAAILAWAKAWSRQDSEAYLAFYSEAFRPAGQVDRDSWATQRKTRLSSPDFIRVDISQLATRVLANDVVSARFRQRYQSDRFRETSTKLLLLKYENDKWRILQESEVK